MCKCHQYINGDDNEIHHLKEYSYTSEPESSKTSDYLKDDAAFEQAVYEMVKASAYANYAGGSTPAPQLWASLVNVVWVNDEKKIKGTASFRGADDIVGDLWAGTWYMSSEEAVHGWVLDGMAKLGWRPESWALHGLDLKR